MDLNSRQYVVSLDMTRTGSIRESFEMRHNDDNELIIELRDSAGIIDLNASGVLNATLLVTRKDKVDIPLAGTITPEGRASFKLKRASLEKQGMVEVVAQFYFANDVRISTPTLIFNVLRDPSAGAIGDEGDDRTLIEIILNDAPALLEQLQTAYDELVIQKAAFAQFQSDSETAFSNAQNQRSSDFNEDQAARDTAFEEAQTQRATDFNTSQGERATLFNQAQTARHTDYTTWKDAKDTELNQLASDTENSKLAADGATTNANNAATAANTAATNANNKVTELNGYNSRLQSVETETTNARNSAIKGKTLASVDARFEELEGDTYKPMQNLVANGNFANGTTGWTSPNATSFTVTSNEATFTATGQAGNIQAPLSIGNVGDKIYVRAEVKATSNLVLLNNAGILATAFHSGSGQYEVLSSVFNSTGGTTSIRVQDNRTSGWNAISAKKFIEINLTAHFGAGKEPSKEEMDELLTLHYDGWFDGTSNVAKKLLERSAQQLIDTFVPMKNEVVNGDFRNGATAWSLANAAVINNELEITLTSPVTVTQTLTTTVGSQYYLRISGRSDGSTASLLARNYSTENVSNSLVFDFKSTSKTELSGILTNTLNGTTLFMGRAGTTGKAYIDDIMMIDLTKTFGAGNEPTKEEMDRLLAKYPNSFFDGTVNLTPKLLDDLRYLTSDVNMPMSNKVANGNFSQGTTGWASLGPSGTITVTNGELTHTTTSVQSYAGITIPTQNFFKTNVGDKVYISYDFKPFRTHTPFVYLAGVYITFPSAVTSAVAGVWNDISNIFTVNSVNNDQFALSDNGVSTIDMVAGSQTSYRNIIVLNLTQIFGAGNEPTKAQMDALLSTYPNSWFDGTVNLAENKRIIPFLLKRLELKADKAQEAWITPTLQNGATGSIRFRKNQFGVLEFEGTVQQSNVSSQAFILPVGYRPSATLYVPVAISASEINTLTVGASGSVFLSVGNKQFHCASVQIPIS